MAEIKDLRVLIVGYGRAQVTFLERLVKGLVNEGVQITLATASKRILSRFPQGSVQWLYAPSWDGGGLTRIARVVVMMMYNLTSNRKAWLQEQVRQGQTHRERFELLYRYLPFGRGDWDVIYFPWNSAATDYSGLYQLGVPVTVSCRGSQVNIRPHLPGEEAYKEKLRVSLSKAEMVHCVSDQIRQEVLSMGVTKEKTVVIHPSVDPTFFSPASRPSTNHLQLISVGSLIWTKGYEYLLQAINILKNKNIDVKLQIVGEGNEIDRILFTISDLDLAENVELLGKLKPEAVLEKLQQADVFVLSSLSEGISNAVLEAMSCGLPIVTTDCGGMREAITDGVEGYVVPIRNPEAMAEALYKLAIDPALRQQMGQAGRLRVMEYFHLSDQIDKFINMFNQVRVNKTFTLK